MKKIDLLLELESVLRKNIKNRAITINLETKLVSHIKELRRSLQSEADTSKER
ncbi:hypothetical protein [Paenibacillus sp. BC26]|uniref:hypothetical protein n=1 Tax=Paenibacillus sp. BC26 TaxID=1881032 RepID=UPI0015A5555E|nr:hypothetical protein [Paenibacillus sp. BC26]